MRCGQSGCTASCDSEGPGETMPNLTDRIRSYRKFADAFRAFSAWMKNGTYRLDWSLTTASLCQNDAEDAEVKSFLATKREETGKTRLKSFILNLFRLTNRNCAGTYQCTKILLTESGVVKGFDFGKGVVCSLFPTEKDAELFIRRKEQAAAVFPSAKTIDFQKNKLFLTEELLSDDGTDIETKFNAILLFYVQKSADEKRTEYRCPIFRSDERIGRVFEKTLAGAEQTYGQLRSCIRHGDLWDGNVFLRGGTLRFIDFDKMKEHMCLYDILLYIFTEAFINRNLILLKKYLAGEYHREMCGILKTDESEIFDYEAIFVIFLNEMFLDRFQNADRGFLMQVLNAAESWGIRLNVAAAEEKEGVGI